MLYERNNEKILDDNLFFNPGKEYRGTPFWAWNDALDNEQLERQIEYFKEMGFGGYHMHPRYGMKTEYLSKEYLECVLHCINYGKSRDMLSWLYDEDRWPSGFAGGLVTKNPKYRQRAIYVTKNAASIPEVEEDKDKAVSNGLPYMIGCYDVELDTDGVMISFRKIDSRAEARFDKYYVYSSTDAESGMYNNQTYTDIMQPEAVKAFIELTHKSYYNIAGNEYGKCVPAIFTDEPRQKPVEPYEDINDRGVYYWTYDFDITFKEKYGYDIVENIPAIIWNTPDNDTAYVRYDYFNHAADLMANAFFKQISEVTTEQGLALTGHLMFENELFGQIRWTGDAMRMYPYFTFPGIDMLRDRVELATAKQAQSIVHQYGKEAMLSEMYGVTGWDFDFKCMKMQGDWQAALGVTIRVPHLSLLSMEGKAKRDYPASYNYQAPWYKEYKYIEDHFARLNTVLTRGKPKVSVAVLHPVETAMLHIATGEKSAQRLKQSENDFQDIIRWLLYSAIDFDFINEALLPEQIVDCKDKLKVGHMEYDTIVIPCIDTIRSTTVKILEKFRESGGKVIFTGKCPEYENGRKSDSAKKLYENSIHIMNRKSELLEALEGNRVISVKNSDGSECDDLIYQLREDNDCLWLFIAQARHLGKKAPERNSCVARKIVVTINGKYNVMQYDTIRGNIRSVDYNIHKDKTDVNYELYANDSLLLKLTNKPIIQNEVHSLVKKSGEKIFLDRVECKRTEENIVVLDMAKYSLDGVQYSDKEYVLEINNIVLRQSGIQPSDAQPYIMNKEKYNKVCLRFEFESEIEAEGLFLAIERAKECTIFLNGIHVDKKTYGYYIDEAFKKIKLPKVKKGVNVLDIETTFSMIKRIEPCYLLGDFNVTLMGCVPKLCAPTSITGFGGISSYGMPFYGGNLIYEAEIRTEACTARIKVSDFGAPCVRVFVDGEDAGLIALAPFYIEKRLSRGMHKIELVCYGNRNNTLGPVHNCMINNSDYCIAPSAWEKTCEYWRHSYFFQETGILSSPVIEFLK